MANEEQPQPRKPRERKKRDTQTIEVKPNLPAPDVKGKHIAYDLRSPQDIGNFAKVLQKFIKDGGLSMKFRAKDTEEYVLCDGWKFAALNFGLTPRIDSCVKISQGEIYHVFFEERMNQYNQIYQVAACVTDIPEEIEERKANVNTKRFIRIREITYQVKCSLVNIVTGEVIGDGEAICSNLEKKKLEFDQYACLSMGQTRAISKACKNLLGFVMRAAGFAETPAEEMQEEYTHAEKPPVPPQADSVNNKGAKIEENEMETIKASLALLNTPEEVDKYGGEQTPAMQKNLVFRSLCMARKKAIKATQPTSSTPAQ